MANKLISQLTGAGANVQDTDLMEVQKNGELITKKVTGLQARGVEKLERETQDDVIEAGAGLDTDGTFTAAALTPDTWYLRAGDFAAGCTDRGGATGALTESIVSGLRLLDARVYQLGNGSVVIAYLGVNSDTTYANVIPAGYMLEYVIFEEKSGASPILDLGTSAGGNQVFINQALTSSNLTTIVVDRLFSFSSNQTLYLNDDDAGSTWDGSTVDLYFVLRPITAGGTVAAVTGSITFGYYSTAFAATPPTEAEITALIGDPATFPAGATWIVYDSFSDGLFFVITDNVDWWAIGPYPAASFKTV